MTKGKVKYYRLLCDKCTWWTVSKRKDMSLKCPLCSKTMTQKMFYANPVDEKWDICHFLNGIKAHTLNDTLTDKAISDLYEKYPLCKVGIRRALLHLKNTEMCLDGMRINDDGSIDLSQVMNRNRPLRESHRGLLEDPDNT